MKGWDLGLNVSLKELFGMVWFESVIRWLAIIWMGVECEIDEGVAV